MSKIKYNCIWFGPESSLILDTALKHLSSCSSQSKITLLSMRKLIRRLNVKNSVGVDTSAIEFAFQKLQTDHSTFLLPPLLWEITVVRRIETKTCNKKICIFKA